MSNDGNELQRRARAIWGYSNRQQAALADLAGIDRERFKALMGRRPTAVSIEELVELAEHAKVPRQFAERGFAGLWEPDERLAQAVDEVKQMVRELDDRLSDLERERAVGGAAELEQSDASDQPDEDSQSGQQP